MVFESIDGIYKDEKGEINSNIRTIEPDIMNWAHNNEMPINPSSTFYQRKRKN